MGMTLPTEFGGQGRSYHDAALAIEEMVRDARMLTFGGGTAQILRTQIAGSILGIKTPQTRDGYLERAAREEERKAAE